MTLGMGFSPTMKNTKCESLDRKVVQLHCEACFTLSVLRVAGGCLAALLCIETGYCFSTNELSVALFCICNSYPWMCTRLYTTPCMCLSH